VFPQIRLSANKQAAGDDAAVHEIDDHRRAPRWTPNEKKMSPNCIPGGRKAKKMRRRGAESDVIKRRGEKMWRCRVGATQGFSSGPTFFRTRN
jgi:hypothetical protein